MWFFLFAGLSDNCERDELGEDAAFNNDSIFFTETSGNSVEVELLNPGLELAEEGGVGTKGVIV